ncbi:MAG: hypothetical protein ISS50_05435 [Anaerolineae bacterium]|nr:hypothetical protein [Anaerolineae bacterium]
MTRIGEIIETGTMGFVAESLELHQPPALGSLVKVELGDGGCVYGVVSHGATAGLDPGRRAVRRSTEQVYDEAIYDEHPELRHILRTEFSVLLVGCVEDGAIRQHLPAQPPPLHYSVHECTEEEVRAFSERLYYLRLLLSAAGEVPPEQFLAAHVRQAYRQRGQDREWLERAAREIAALLKHDYERLMTVLYAIEPGRRMDSG